MERLREKLLRAQRSAGMLKTQCDGYADELEDIHALIDAAPLLDGYEPTTDLGQTLARLICQKRRADEEFRSKAEECDRLAAEAYRHCRGPKGPWTRERARLCYEPTP